MPFLNSRGDVAHGVGGGYCNINNQRVAFGGVAGWWDDDTVVFFNGNDNWLTSLYHAPTKTIERLDEKYGGPVGGVSGNHGYCSGKKAAAWWLGTTDPAQVGLWSTVGLRKPLAGLMGMGQDNAIAYKPDYQSMGPTVYRRPDGTEWEITAGSTDTPCLLGEDRILWMEGLAPKVLNLPPIKTAPGQQWMGVAQFAAGQWWYCCYSSDHGVILHPFRFPDNLGYSVLPQGNAWVTMRVIANSTLRVCWADHIEEQAGQIHARDYDVAMGIVRDPYAADTSWHTTTLVDVTKINYVPPAVGTASFTLDKVTGPAPLTVTASLTQENLTTWRWLLDGVIDQPIDGLTHTFTIQTEGVHTIGLRAQAPAGPVTVPTQAVGVTAAVPITPPDITDKFYGVQIGFGVPVGERTVQELRTRKWDWNRMVGLHSTDPSKELLQSCVKEAVSAGMVPLVLLPLYAPVNGANVVLAEWVPDGTDIEFYGPYPDPVESGQEIDNRGGDPVEFATMLDAIMPYCRAHGQRVWAPAISNPSAPAYDWLTRFIAALKSTDVGITYHRYQDYGMKQGGDGRTGFRNIEAELDQFKAIIGNRPFGMSEGSWHTGKIFRWQGDVWKALDKILPDGWLSWTLTDEQCRDNWSKDSKIARAKGCTFYIWYQVNEGEGGNSGLRYYPWDDFNWKPEANIPLL